MSVDLNNEVTKDLMSKLSKILARTNSSNKNEAEVAMSKINKLMEEHNLSLEEIEKFKNPDAKPITYVLKKSMIYGKEPMEYKYIWPILQDFYFVKAITYPIVMSSFNMESYNQRNGFTKNPPTSDSDNWDFRQRFQYAFFGQDHNVEIALYMYDYLKNVFDSCFKTWVAESKQNKKQIIKQMIIDGHDLEECFAILKNAHTYRNSFYDGFYRGIYTRLKLERDSNPNCMALTVINEDLNSELQKAVKTVKNTKQYAKAKVENDALQGGYNAGLKTSLNPALKSGETNKQLTK